MSSLDNNLFLTNLGHSSSSSKLMKSASTGLRLDKMTVSDRFFLFLPFFESQFLRINIFILCIFELVSLSKNMNTVIIFQLKHLRFGVGVSNKYNYKCCFLQHKTLITI